MEKITYEQKQFFLVITQNRRVSFLLTDSFLLYKFKIQKSKFQQKSKIQNGRSRCFISCFNVILCCKKYKRKRKTQYNIHKKLYFLNHWIVEVSFFTFSIVCHSECEEKLGKMIKKAAICLKMLEFTERCRV